MRARYEATDQVLYQTDFQTTRIAVDITNGENVVMKEFLYSPDEVQSFIRETELLKRLNEPHLNELFNVYEDAEKCYFVQNLTYSANLFEHILSLKYYSQDDAKCFIKEILLGVAYLHFHNVYHGNLKPENLLYDSALNCVKIADYGYYNLFPLDKLMYAPAFCSPEQLLDEPMTGQEDVYAIGVISCLLLLGRLPQVVDTQDFIRDHVIATLNGKYDLRKHSLSQNAVNFIQNCFLPQETRPCVFELLKHPFLNEKAPVIPLQSTQLNLERYLARMKLENGSSVNALALVQLAQKIAGFEPKAEEIENTEDGEEVDDIDNVELQEPADKSFNSVPLSE